MRIFISVVFTIFYLVSQVQSKIKFVTSAYRHGARTPGKNFYDGKDQPHNQLTGVGMRQQYGLGQIIRQKYIEKEGLLSEQLNFDEIMTFSTDVDRTLLSATCQLLGIYPFGTGQNLYPGVDPKYTLPPYEGIQYKDIGQEALPEQFQPMIVHTTSEDSNYIMNPKCRNMIPILAKFVTKPSTLLKVNKFVSLMEPTVKASREMFDDNSIQIWDLFMIQDVLISDLYQGRTMPEGFSIDSDYWRNMTFCVSYGSFFLQQDQQALNIQNSNFFNTMIQNFDAVVDGEAGIYKWSMFSAHDSNLANWMPGLNLTSSDCIMDLYKKGTTDALNCHDSPPFAANLFVELHQDESEGYYIKIQYDGEYQNVCEQESHTCSYEEFRERITYQSLTQEEQNEVCKNKGEDDQGTDGLMGEYMIEILKQSVQGDQNVEISKQQQSKNFRKEKQQQQKLKFEYIIGEEKKEQTEKKLGLGIIGLLSIVGVMVTTYFLKK